ncbi:RHS repeat-associated core domain-containing protein [Prosthecobacter sp.]|uniref:RHS repeat-associated core domain-containing protein n=1 Tax=Prosthecobacter sp. TaxID=1965333 RepID=UPI0037851C69
MPGGGGASGTVTLTYTDGRLPVQGTWETTKGIFSLSTHPEALVNDPVDTATGAYYASYTLLKQNCPASLDFTIEYRSTLRATGPLGAGWGHNFETRVDSINSGQTLIFNWTQNRRNYFDRVGTTNNYTTTDLAMRYDTLTKNGDGSFTLVRSDMSRMEFNSAGRLTQKRNKHGQAINLTYNGANQLVTVTEAISGKTLSFQYDGNGRVSQVTDTLGRMAMLGYTSGADTLNGWQITESNGTIVSGTLYAYDGLSRITAAQDYNGVTFLVNTYDDGSRVITQNDGRQETPLTSFAYDATSTAGRLITRVTDRNGKVLTYTFDTAYQLLSIVNGNGETTAYTYDVNGNRLSTTDALGHTTSFSYDAQGNVTSITDPANAVTSMAYDAQNNLTRITNAAQKSTTFAYDTNNNVLTVTNALNQSITTAYNSNSLPTQRSSARNGVTTYAYTAGLPTSITDANNNTTTMGFDAAGRLLSITDAAGKTRTITYDAADSILTAKDPLNNTSTYTYDKRGRRLTEKNPLNQIITYTYDGNGNLSTRTDPLGNKTRFFYDSEDRLARIVDPRGGGTDMIYDSVGRLVAMTNQVGQTETLRYDAAGNRSAIVDARGNRTRTTYDSRNVNTSIEDPHARKTSLSFDNLRRLTQSTNALGEVLQMAYDDLDRLVSVTDPLNQVSGQTFDADGNRITLTNARNATTNFTFDLGGRLTGVTVPDNRTTSYGYNSRDLLSTVTEPSGQQTTLTYDDAGRLTQSVDPAGTISYGFDAASRLLTMTEGAVTITRVYDAAGRLTQFTDAAGNLLKYAYDSAGNLTVLTYPDNKTVTYVYDAANRLITVTDWASRVTSYTYDADGRLATTTRPDGSVETRTWLPTGELASLDDRKGTTIFAQYTYSYDLAGRIVSENPQPLPAAFTPTPFTATYDTGNRLATFNGTSVTFDVDGNMTTGPVVSGSGFGAFTYDSRNRLTSFGGVSYGYDAENRRVSWTDGTGTTRFVINPNAALSQVLVRTAPDGTITRAVHGLGLIYEETGSTLRLYHYDYRGSAVAFTNASGTVTGRVEYGPYGEIASRVNDTATPFLFNGIYGVMTDPNGLCHMRARYYHPGIRRFVNQDIVFGTLVDQSSLNRFSFANGNPINFVDPFGLSAYKPNDGGIRHALLSFGRQVQLLHDVLVFLHYERNMFNVTPANPNEAIDQKWRRLTDDESIFHQQTNESPCARYNTKYISPDGHSEVVFNRNGVLVLDPRNIGSYNLFDPLRYPNLHGAFDVVPYVLLGNASNDPSTFSERVMAAPNRWAENFSLWVRR